MSKHSALAEAATADINSKTGRVHQTKHTSRVWVAAKGFSLGSNHASPYVTPMKSGYTGYD